MHRLLLNHAFIPITSSETILHIKSWCLRNPKSAPNTAVWLQIHMGSCLKSTLWLINQFSTVRGICLIIIDIFYVLTLQSVLADAAQIHLALLLVDVHLTDKQRN